ncbi:hypothetical protein V7S79_08680 [Aquirufa sp. ROCK-SH2]
MRSINQKTIKKNLTTSEKLEIGMAQVKINLMAYKKAKKSDLVVLQENKIVFLKPE